MTHKLASAVIVVAVAGAGAGTTAVFTTSSSGSSSTIAQPAQVQETDANGYATVAWSAPATQSAVIGYRVSLYPTYTDRVPKPDLGPNGGLQQETVPASTDSFTFKNLYEDCHQRYEMSVETVTSAGLSQPVFTQSFRPSGYVIPHQAPPYVVVLVDGIDSQQPGFSMNPYHPSTGSIQSYCPESWNPQQKIEQEADFAKPYGLAPASGPTGPWSFFHKWNHGETDSNGNPTAGDSGGPNLLYASEPKLVDGPAANGGQSSFTHTFMLDDIAASGAIILPFSYHSNLNCITSLGSSLDGIGAQVTGSVQNLTFNFPAYGKSDSDPIPFVNDLSQPCRGNITYWAQILAAELRSIHQIWPTSKLVVMGHSQGGLVVANAWQQDFALATSTTPVDIQAFSLDSPINGVCAVQLICLGPPSYPDYSKRGTYDEGSGGYLGMDQNRGNNMHFVGTYGDSPAIPIPLGTLLSLAGIPAPDQLNYAVSLKAYGTGSETLEHQMPFWYSTQDPPSPGSFGSDYIEAHCNVMAGAVVNPQCPAPSPPDFVSTCPVDYFSVPQWITDTGHFVVKYCLGVVNFFNQTLGLSPTAAPTPVPSAGGATSTTGGAPSEPPPAPAGPATKLITYEPWTTSSSPSGIDAPDPILSISYAAGSCDAGSTDDPGRFDAYRCTISGEPAANDVPPGAQVTSSGVGNGSPCFVTRNSGDAGSPLLCSSDPTSNQVVELLQNGNTVPTTGGNKEDPSQPPWYIVLADGLKCSFDGYATNHDVLPYNCPGNVGTTVPDRSGSTWSVQEGSHATVESSETPPTGPRVAVVEAYR